MAASADLGPGTRIRVFGEQWKVFGWRELAPHRRSALPEPPTASMPSRGATIIEAMVEPGTYRIQVRCMRAGWALVESEKRAGVFSLVAAEAEEGFGGGLGEMHAKQDEGGGSRLLPATSACTTT